MAGVSVNGIPIEASQFAYDGCHKIYVCESPSDVREAAAGGYSVLPIEQLEETFRNSCGLEFISNWSLTKQFVRQFEEACFGRV